MAKAPRKRKPPCKHVWREGRSTDGNLAIRRCIKCDKRQWKGRKQGYAEMSKDWKDGERTG